MIMSHTEKTETNQTLRCNRCKNEKPIADFYFYKSKTCGIIRYDNYCRECRKEYNRQRHFLKNKERIEAARVFKENTPERHKYCPRCARILPFEKYHIMSSTGKPYTYCRECSRERAKKYKRKPKEKKKIFRHKDGRFYAFNDTYRKFALYWSGDMISVLNRYYPNTSNQEIAEMLGVCSNTVIRKAHSLGLSKDEEYIRQLQSKGGRQSKITRKIKTQQHNSKKAKSTPTNL